VQLRERPEGYQESFGPDHEETTRVFDVQWIERKAAIKALLGYSTFTGDTGGGVVRYIPWADPDYPWLFASEVTTASDPLGVAHWARNELGTRVMQIVQRDNRGNINEQLDAENPSGYARYAVRFAQRPYEVPEGYDSGVVVPGGEQALTCFVQREKTYSAENITFDPSTSGSAFCFLNADGSLARDKNDKLVNVYEILSRTFSLFEVTFTWFGVPWVPLKHITECIGHTNKAVFDDAALPGFSGYDPETMLFIGYTEERMPNHAMRNDFGGTLGGRIAYKLQYKWGYRPQTWSKLFRPFAPGFSRPRSDDDFYKIQRVGDQNNQDVRSIYETVDMFKLFKLDNSA
jgi:hypothetical protein